MIEKNKKFILKISSFYTAIFFIFIAIPTYFYTNLELESYKNEQNRILIEYSQKIQRTLYDFSNSKDDTFIFPKSFKFEATILNENKELIYKTRNLKIDEKSKLLSQEVELSKNRLDGKYLIVSKKISFTEIYLKILVLFLIIGLFIFISVYLIIKASIEPYKKANEYLDAFFNDAMHELKTPLGIIQLNLEILEEKEDKKLLKSKELQRSINATKNLFLVYEDIEYLIKEKSVKYNKEYVDFSYLIKQRIDQFESLAKPRNIKFNLNIDNKIKLLINRTHLIRLIDNTISNAIKYSFNETQISINLYEENLNLDKNKIIFSVNNFGEIIKNKKIIFERYVKQNHIKGGFGIGLNIVKNICKENNISIDLESNKENGTTFKYTFFK